MEIPASDMEIRQLSFTSEPRRNLSSTLLRPRFNLSLTSPVSLQTCCDIVATSFQSCLDPPVTHSPPVSLQSCCVIVETLFQPCFDLLVISLGSRFNIAVTLLQPRVWLSALFKTRTIFLKGQ
jgi:hypothetical protein